MNLMAYPNPSSRNNTFKYSVDAVSKVKIMIHDLNGKLIKVLADKTQEAGVYTIQWDSENISKGTYIVTASKNGVVKQTIKVVKN